MPLTVDEKSIIKLYLKYSNRNRIIEEITASIPITEEYAIRETMKSVVRKLTAMSDESYSNIEYLDTICEDD